MQFVGGLLRVVGRPDELDDLVDVVDGDLQTFEDVLPVARLGEVELAPAYDDPQPVSDEVLQHLAQRHDLRLAVDERQQDGAERRLHLRVLVQAVQHDVRHRVALELDHDAHAVAVGLVAHVADLGELLVAHQPRDLLDEARLVHHERDLGDDDPLGVRVDLFDLGLRPHDDAAAPGPVRVTDALAAAHVAAGREVRTLHDLLELLLREVGLGEQRDDRIADLGQVVRRDVRRHSDRDSRRAVDQQVRELRRQDRRLLDAAVEVVAERDGVLVDVLDELEGEPLQPGLGVPVGRGGITVDRAEVPLPVDERIAQRERLHHAHHRVVHRGVTVRVVLTEHVTDHGRALLVRPARPEAELAHRVEDAAVHGLQAVPYVREGALHDDAHRIVDERLPHLVFDQPLQDGRTAPTHYAVVTAVITYELLLVTHTGFVLVKSRARTVCQSGRRRAFEVREPSASRGRSGENTPEPIRVGGGGSPVDAARPGRDHVRGGGAERVP